MRRCLPGSCVCRRQLRDVSGWMYRLAWARRCRLPALASQVRRRWRHSNALPPCQPPHESCPSRTARPHHVGSGRWLSSNPEPHRCAGLRRTESAPREECSLPSTRTAAKQTRDPRARAAHPEPCARSFPSRFASSVGHAIADISQSLAFAAPNRQTRGRNRHSWPQPFTARHRPAAPGTS